MTGEADPSKRVELCRQSGGDPEISIDAAIDDKGNLLLSGQELGKSVREYWGDDDLRVLAARLQGARGPLVLPRFCGQLS